MNMRYASKNWSMGAWATVSLLATLSCAASVGVKQPEVNSGTALQAPMMAYLQLHHEAEYALMRGIPPKSARFAHADPRVPCNANAKGAEHD